MKQNYDGLQTDTVGRREREGKEEVKQNYDRLQVEGLRGKGGKKGGGTKARRVADREGRGRKTARKQK